MSELKCIYWENAIPDDFINARRGETWIQGVGEVDTFYAENLVHNFGKAWKEKLRRESVSELKPDIHNIEAITLKKFADRHGLIMEVHERRRPISDPARYYACFKNSEIEEKGFLMSAFGDGSTPDEAISNYIKRIEFKLLVIDAYTSNRRKIEVPRIIIPHPAPAEVEDLLDHIISAANSVSIPSESNYLNELKSRLLAALSNTTPYLSQDVNVPVEELEAGKEYYMTMRVKAIATGSCTKVRWATTDNVFYHDIEAQAKQGATFRKAGE